MLECGAIERSRVVIAYHLYREAKPLTLSEIAEKSGLSPQLVNHHLPIMITEGLALKIVTDDKTYYALQAFYYDAGIMDSIFQAYTPIVDYIREHDCDYSQSTIERPRALMNNIQLLSQLFNAEICKMKNKK